MSMGEWVRGAIEKALKEQKTTTNALAKLAALDAPTGDIEQMLGEIEDGRR
jgi:hypothetical protein